VREGRHLRIEQEQGRRPAPGRDGAEQALGQSPQGQRRQRQEAGLQQPQAQQAGVAQLQAGGQQVRVERRPERLELGRLPTRPALRQIEIHDLVAPGPAGDGPGVQPGQDRLLGQEGQDQRRVETPPEVGPARSPDLLGCRPRRTIRASAAHGYSKFRACTGSRREARRAG
jgi:hypothetical protein